MSNFKRHEIIHLLKFDWQTSLAHRWPIHGLVHTQNIVWNDKTYMCRKHVESNITRTTNLSYYFSGEIDRRKVMLFPPWHYRVHYHASAV